MNHGAGGSQVIQRRIAQALKVRTRIPMAADVDAAQPLLPGATWEVKLENIGLEGLYRALLIAVRDVEVKMVTNLTLRPGGPPHVGPPGSVLLSHVATSQLLSDSIGAQLAQLQFDDGAGGRESAHDGSVHFLTIRSTAHARTTALYFYHYPATTSHWHKPDGTDGPRWDAVRVVYEIWHDLVTNPVVRSTP